MKSTLKYLVYRAHYYTHFCTWFKIEALIYLKALLIFTNQIKRKSSIYELIEKLENRKKLFKYHRYQLILPFLNKKFNGNDSNISYELLGWCYDPIQGLPEKILAFDLNGKEVPQSSIFCIRKDVNKHFNVHRFSKTGFRVAFPKDENHPFFDIILCAQYGNQIRKIPFHETIISSSEKLPSPEFIYWNNQKINLNHQAVGYIDHFFFSKQELFINQILNIPANFIEKYKPAILCFMQNSFRLKKHEIFEWYEEKFGSKLELEKNKYFLHTCEYIGADEKCDGLTVETLKKPYPFTYELPQTVPKYRKNSNTHTEDVPAEQIYSVENGSILFGSMVLMKDRKILMWDRSSEPNEDFVAGYWRFMFGHPTKKNHCILFGEIEETLEINEAILLDGRCSLNYFHWLIEYLPRLKTICEIDNLKEIPLVVSENMPETMKDSLRLLAPSRQIIWINEKTLVNFKRLHVPSMHTYHPDKFNQPTYANSAVSFEHLQYVRETILLQVDLPTNRTRKIYVDRMANLARGTKNSGEIRKLCYKLGLEFIDPSTLTFKEQVALFNSASLVVGPAGAAFANLIFCNKNCKVICFAAERLRQYCMQSILAHFSGAEFVFVTGKDYLPKGVYNDYISFHHSPYVLRLKDFSSAVIDFKIAVPNTATTEGIEVPMAHTPV